MAIKPQRTNFKNRDSEAVSSEASPEQPSLSTDEKTNEQAPVRVIREPSAIAGLDEETMAAAEKEADRRLLSKQPFIELPIGNKLVRHQLHVIQPSDIMTKTSVPVSNGRVQAFLNKKSLSDILDTLSEHGQQFPARGRMSLDESDIIQVDDGSRRRMSCHLANKPFFVYVATESVSDADAAFISKVGNNYKPLSLYEQGLNFQSLLSSGVYSEQKDIAEAFETTKSVVSDAVKFSKIPEDILSLFPSVNELGRPTLTKLSNMSALIGDEVRQQCEEYLREILSFDKNGKQLNSLMMKRLSTLVLSSKSSNTRTRSKVYTLGDSKLRVRDKDNNLSMDVSNIDSKFKSALYQLIETHFGVNPE